MFQSLTVFCFSLCPCCISVYVRVVFQSMSVLCFSLCPCCVSVSVRVVFQSWCVLCFSLCPCCFSLCPCCFSLWLCTFTLAVSGGAVLLLPMSIVANEALHSFPNSYYLKWVNSSLIHGTNCHIYSRTPGQSLLSIHHICHHSSLYVITVTSLWHVMTVTAACHNCHLFTACHDYHLFSLHIITVTSFHSTS